MHHHRDTQGYKGYKGYKDGLQPESLADGKLAGETKSTSVENWNQIWHTLEESVWVLI